MVEALRDYKTGECGDRVSCYVSARDMKNYKNISAQRSQYPQFREYDYNIWKDIIDVFAMRISCLFGFAGTLKYDQYSEQVSPREIYSLEAKKTPVQGAFVLSAFPEFLVDYYGMRLWRTCVRHKTNRRNHKTNSCE